MLSGIATDCPSMFVKSDREGKGQMEIYVHVLVCLSPCGNIDKGNTRQRRSQDMVVTQCGSQTALQSSLLSDLELEKLLATLCLCEIIHKH